MEKNEEKGHTVLYCVLFALTVAADQLFKRWITLRIPLNPAPSETLPMLPGVVHLTHIHNSGAAFGMMEGGRWIFLGLLAVFCGLVVYALKTRWFSDEFTRITAVLAAAGAVGNGIDRAMYGYVVDMFELEFMRFAVFNVADSVLCVCAALFAIKTLTEKDDK